MKRQPMPAGPMGNQMPPEDPGMTMLADAIENLTNHVEILVKNQEYLTTVQERTADMLERQAFAIERIVSHLSMKSQPRSDAPPLVSETSDEILHQSQASAAADQAVTTQTEPAEDQPVPRQSRKTADKDFFPEDILTPADPEKKTIRRVIRKRKKPVAAKNPSTETAADTALLPREKVMDIIQTMRRQNATYDQIAKHLVKLGQPTFSGRGEWHAQTIHRLCSKK